MKKDEREDMEADLFARCLLMPEFLVREEVKKIRDAYHDRSFKERTPEHIVHELASKFRVSDLQMTKRLMES